LYRVLVDSGRKNDDDKGYGALVGVGAYVLYVVSEYVVLWFSRTREYYADRFAGKVTGNPNALASALVKIAYGLAAQEGPAEAKEDEKKEKSEKTEKRQASRIEALGALNIFNREGAVSLVMASAGSTADKKLDPEQVKGAMQWDLWNPWAKFYE